MCGRYITAQAEKFERAVSLGKINWHFDISYNVAPTHPVPVIRTMDSVWEGLMMRWGLIPFFAHGVAPKYSTINATVERLETGPAWRGPWRRGQRCIQMAAGFYEWQLAESGQKQPYFIHLSDHDVFGFASIWDRSFVEEGTGIESCALVTVPGNALMREIHNSGANPYRMPAILAPADFEIWLEGGLVEAKALLKPYPQELMTAYRVSTRVNSPKNNGPTLIEPAFDQRAAG
jgi:putative SOS response-associated peptidase YedK